MLTIDPGFADPPQPPPKPQEPPAPRTFDERDLPGSLRAILPR